MIRVAFKPFLTLPVFLALMFADAGGQTTISLEPDNGKVLYRMPPLPVSASVSGRIYTEIGTAVPWANLNFIGTDAGVTFTDANGYYFINLDEGGNYAIVPSRYNDTTITNGVSTIDLLLIRQHILSTLSLNSPYKIIAGDVDGNGTVSTIDYLLVRSVILRINRAYPSGKTWVFVKSDFAFSNPSQPFPYQDFRTYSNIQFDYQNQDFIGIKLGDVNNSWDPNALKLNAVEHLQFELDSFYVQPGAEVIVPVKVKNFNNVSGFQFTLLWNPEVLSLHNVSNEVLENYFGWNEVSSGYLTVNWVDESGKAVTLDENKNVFELRFKVIGEAGDFSDIKICSDITPAEAYNENFDLLDVIPMNGMVKVESSNKDANHFQYAAYPNPFKGMIRVSFLLEQSELVSFLAYDVNGKEVANQSDFLQAGSHQWVWDGSDFSGEKCPSGIYYLQIKTGKESRVVKIMRME